LITIKRIEAKTGDIIPIIETDKNSFPLHSKYTPTKEGELFAQKYKDANVIITIGIGYGYHINKLFKDKLILAIEEEKISNLLSDSIERKKLKTNNNLKCYTEKEISFLIQDLITNISQNNQNKIAIIILEGYKRYNPIFCKNISQKIEKQLKNYADDKATIDKYKKRWEFNYKSNIKQIKNSNIYKTNFLDFTNKNIIISAAGPSLNRNIKQIKEELSKKNTILIATDSSIPILKKEKIQANYIVTIDCQHYSLIHYKAVGTNYLKQAILIKDIFAPPSIDKYFNQIYIVFPPHPSFMEINRESPLIPIYKTGGNVTYSALSIAINSGAKKISIYGADFEYKNSKPYGDGAAYYQIFNSISTRVNQAEESVYKMSQNEKSKKLLKDYKIVLENDFKEIIKLKNNGIYKLYINDNSYINEKLSIN